MPFKEEVSIIIHDSKLLKALHILDHIYKIQVKLIYKQVWSYINGPNDFNATFYATAVLKQTFFDTESSFNITVTSTSDTDLLKMFGVVKLIIYVRHHL